MINATIDMKMVIAKIPKTTASVLLIKFLREIRAIITSRKEVIPMTKEELHTIFQQADADVRASFPPEKIESLITENADDLPKLVGALYGFAIDTNHAFLESVLSTLLCKT